MSFEQLGENFTKNHIDVPVDYTQWQRNRRKTQHKKVESKRSLKKVNYPTTSPIHEKRSFICHKEEKRFDSPIQTYSLKNTHKHVLKGLDGECSVYSLLHKECSTRCRHGVAIKPQEVKTEQKKSKDGVISLLKIQIKEKQVSLRESKQRYLQLIRDNIHLKDDVTGFEQEKYQDVRQLLESYRRYRDGFSVLTSQHSQDVKKQERNLQETCERCGASILVLQNEVDKLDDDIADEKHSLKVLLNYKEKEYPEKMEQIRNLKEELDYLEADFEENMAQLTEIAAVEEKRFKEHKTGQIEDVTTRFAENAITNLDVSVKEMARRNLSMKKELITHVEEEERHRKEIGLLQHEIRQLKKAEEKRLAYQKHPELFADKCYPDTEFVLSIPMHGSVLF